MRKQGPGGAPVELFLDTLSRPVHSEENIPIKSCCRSIRATRQDSIFILIYILIEQKGKQNVPEIAGEKEPALSALSKAKTRHGVQRRRELV